MQLPIQVMPFETAHVFLPGGYLIAAEEIAHRGEIIALPRRVEQEHVGGVKRVEWPRAARLRVAAVLRGRIPSLVRKCFSLRPLLFSSLRWLSI